MRLLTLKSASLRDSGKPYGSVSAMAKLYASKVAVDSALEAIQVHGGYGYVKDYPIERYLRDAKITEIYEGDLGSTENSYCEEFAERLTNLTL